MECYICGGDIGPSLGLCSPCKEDRTTRWKSRAQTQTYPPETSAAGFWLRFLADCIDGSIIHLGTVILSSLGLDPIFSIHLSPALSKWGATISELILPSESFSLAAIALGLAVSAFIGFIFLSLRGYLLYGPLFESSPMMATPGKWLLGLTVVDLDCRRLSLPQAMLRTIAKGLSWLSYGVGFLSVGLTPTKQGLHDILARTQVVQQAQCSKTTIALVLGSHRA